MTVHRVHQVPHFNGSSSQSVVFALGPMLLETGMRAKANAKQD